MSHLQILLRLTAVCTPLGLQPITKTRARNELIASKTAKNERHVCLRAASRRVTPILRSRHGQGETTKHVKLGRRRQIFAASLRRYQVSTTGTACLARTWKG